MNPPHCSPAPHIPTGSLAMIMHSVVALPAAAAILSCIEAGCKRLEEEMAIELIKKGNMNENSLYFSIIIFGHDGTVWAVVQWVGQLVMR